MGLTKIDKCVLEHVFLNQPSSGDVVDTAYAFARMMGHSCTEEEISRSLTGLISKRQIVEITFDIAASILKELDDAHGPIVPIRAGSHYSVTAIGGAERLAYCPLDDPMRIGGRGVVAAEHTQFFTPSNTLANQLTELGVFSNNKLKVFNVYLAPNNDNVNGFIVETLAAPGIPSHPVRLLQEHATLLRQELEQNYERQSTPIGSGLTSGELLALISLSGYSGSYTCRDFGEGDIQSLIDGGFVRKLQKPEAIQMSRELSSRRSIAFGPKPRPEMHILTDAGKDVLLRVLSAIPSLQQHLLVSRVAGEYVHQYFPDLNQAIEAHTKLKAAGKQVTDIEHIGKWSYFWWDIHLDGARFSFWNSDVE